MLVLLFLLFINLTLLCHGLANLPHGTEWKTVVFNDETQGEVERSYIQYIPSTYNGEEPVPMVVDFHGWTSSAENQMNTESQWHILAEEFGIIVVFVDGVPDSPSLWRSWNINNETGVYGDPCERDRGYWGVYECHFSCEGCDPYTTCKAGMTCYNDQAFVEFLIERLQTEFTISQNRIHITGFSNGGQFTYFLASHSSLNVASLAPVSGSPLLGFGPVPGRPVSIIDFHGLEDESIPQDINYCSGYGPNNGPVPTLRSYDGMFYYRKADYLNYLADTWNCSVGWKAWSTEMDGVEGWGCVMRGCPGGVQLVKCSGNYPHGYPFTANKLQGTRILWKFMEETAVEEI